MMGSDETVEAIRVAIQSNYAAVAFALNAAASPAEIDAAESMLGGQLPTSVRGAYLAANGTAAGSTVFFLHGLFRWLPLAEMVDMTVQFRSSASQFPELYPAGAESVFVIADPGNGDWFYLGLVDDVGAESALVLLEHGDTDPQIICDSFGDYLEAFLRELGENPNVAVVDDFGPPVLVNTLEALGVPVSEL